MTLPTIHDNGTSAVSLIDALCNASEALDTAYMKLKLTAPNGRDYYPQGTGAFQAAVDEHCDRLRRLDAIKNEVDAMTRAIDDYEAK
jgi:hypothetical protein